jgi:membrane protease YdiL (CAAX protease family)
LSPALATPRAGSTIVPIDDTPSQAMEFVERAELFLLAAGLIGLVIGAGLLSARRQWRPALRLPHPPQHALEPLDLLTAILAFMVIPSLPFIAMGSGRSADSPAATHPATSDAATPDTDTAQSSLDTIRPTTLPGGDVLPLPAPEVLTPRDRLLLLLGRALGAALLIGIGWKAFGGSLNRWGLRLDRPWRDLGWAALAYVLFWPACRGVLELTALAIQRWAPEYAPELHESLLVLRDPGLPAWAGAVTIVTSILIAPLIEELFFRGILQPCVARWTGSNWIAVIASGLAFGAVHGTDPHTVPALVLMGLLQGWLYARTRCLWLVIWMHVIFNAKQVAWILLGAE